MCVDNVGFFLSPVLLITELNAIVNRGCIDLHYADFYPFME